MSYDHSNFFLYLRCSAYYSAWFCDSNYKRQTKQNSTQNDAERKDVVLSMKEVINLLPVGEYLRTSYHLREFTKALDHLQTAYFKQKQGFLDTLTKEVPFPLNDLLKKLAIENEVNLDNTAEVDSFLIRVREDIQVIPHLTLTVSVEPTMELITAINQWIIINLRKAIILDFIIDPKILGGTRIAYQGKIVDHSLLKLIEPIMAGIQQTPLPEKQPQNVTLNG